MVTEVQGGTLLPNEILVKWKYDYMHNLTTAIGTILSDANIPIIKLKAIYMKMHKE